MKELSYKYGCYIEAAGVSKENIQKVMDAWNESHRFYHNTEHLQELFDHLDTMAFAEEITATQKEILVNVAFFHDAIYNPISPRNEEDSADLFLAMSNPSYEHRQVIYDIIIDTKTHVPRTELSEKFIDLDLYGLRYGNLQRLILDGNKIFKEYQKVPYHIYKPERIKFLRSYMEKAPENKENLELYIQYLENYVPRVAIYPGSFNPFHKGHLDILQKAERIFDKVIISIGINPEKAITMDEKAYTDIMKSLPLTVQNREISFFSGYLSDYVKQREEQGLHVTVVKGLRDAKDLDYEFTQLRYIEDQYPEIKIIYLPTDRNLGHIASRVIRDMEKLEPGSSEEYRVK